MVPPIFAHRGDGVDAYRAAIYQGLITQATPYPAFWHIKVVRIGIHSM
jgi:hypothetical protein